MQMTASNEEHGARRSVLNEALPTREQAFSSLDQLARKFADTAGSYPIRAGKELKVGRTSVDISEVSTWFSFDVISSVAFGKSFDMLQSAEYRWVPGCLRNTSIFLYWAGYAQPVWLWQWFLGSSLPSLLRMHTAVDAQTYNNFANETLRAKRLRDEKNTGMKSPDIFQHLISTNLFDENDLRADSSLFIAAGSDAVRLTIAATIFYWLKYPAIFEKAVEEIRSCVSSAEQITASRLSSLRYLRACVDESLRLCPPKASSLPREVMKGGITIDDIHVPEGMTVGISMYALHRNPHNYSDPSAYRPDRWLQGPQERRPAAFSPFLRGPRMCPGQTIAYFAIQLALFHLIYRYDVKATVEKATSGVHENIPEAWKEENQYTFNDWILGFANGPHIELSKRKS